MCIRDSYWAVEAIFRNAGQICLAGSRLFVQDEIYDDLMARFVSAAEALTIGDPVSYTHLRAHETVLDVVCRLLLDKKKYHYKSKKQQI